MNIKIIILIFFKLLNSTYMFSLCKLDIVTSLFSNVVVLIFIVMGFQFTEGRVFFLLVQKPVCGSPCRGLSRLFNDLTWCRSWHLHLLLFSCKTMIWRWLNNRGLREYINGMCFEGVPGGTVKVVCRDLKPCRLVQRGRRWGKGTVKVVCWYLKPCRLVQCRRREGTWSLPPLLCHSRQ
jgi:hypothetical protein